MSNRAFYTTFPTERELFLFYPVRFYCILLYFLERLTTVICLPFVDEETHSEFLDYRKNGL